MAMKFKIIPLELSELSIRRKITVESNPESKTSPLGAIYRINLNNFISNSINDIYGIYSNGIFLDKDNFEFKNMILTLKDTFITNYDSDEFSSLYILYGDNEIEKGTYLETYTVENQRQSIIGNTVNFSSPIAVAAEERVICVINNGVVYLLESNDVRFVNNYKKIKFKHFQPTMEDEIKFIVTAKN